MDHTPWRTDPEHVLSLWEMKYLLELGDFTWRPDTHLEIAFDTGPTPILKVKMVVPDTYHPEVTTLVTHQRPLPSALWAPVARYGYGLTNSELLEPCVPLKRFFDILRLELHRISNHEDDEWMRYLGEMLYNPHAQDGKF